LQYPEFPLKITYLEQGVCHTEFHVKQVKQWFKKLDSDNDGSISWMEFQIFMEVNPELLILFMV
jgi:Ca2+-binding EF-hand superfamily protein